MKLKWTDEQKKVISLRDRDILVSAAAGSGKTAVLVERILNLVTQGDDPWDIDQLLIVTFTRAAAGEMKERIRQRLETVAAENPENLHIQRQTTLIHQAVITTIDGFCAQVVRDHFYLLDIEPGFRILEEGERVLLMEDAMEQVLTEYYENKEADFIDFVEHYAGGKTDIEVSQAVFTLYEYAMSHPWPSKWLKACEDSNQIDLFLKLALEMSQEVIRDGIRCLEQAQEIAQEPLGPEKYYDLLAQDIEKFDLLLQADSYGKMGQLLNSLEFGRLPVVKKETIDEDLKKEAQDRRKQAKVIINQLKEKFYFQPEGKMIEEMKELMPMKQVLVSLTERFRCVFQEMKKTQNVMDFSDMEHYAISILISEEDEQASDTAKEYQNRFKGVMIDEYQDSNLVQEKILSAVSGATDGKHRLFMVGDVKQSIYRFRQAKPELFIEKYQTYTKEDSLQQKIDLHMNFRSRAAVIDTVNQVFRYLMHKEIGGITYDKDAELNPGAAFEESALQGEFQKTQVYLTDSKQEDKNAVEAEIELLKWLVKEQLKGIVTDSETGHLRPVHYGDIAILLRSPGSWGDDLLNGLLNEGIPARALSRTGYFAADEVRTVISYLRLLDNARQDIPLVTVLTSSFLGLTDEELAQIRLLDKKESFCTCAERYQEEGDNLILRDKLISFYQELNWFRKEASYRSVHELLMEIYRRTGFYQYSAAMPAGEIRKENLDMLVEKAVAFENTSYHGVFQFIRYLDKLKKYEIDYGIGTGTSTQQAVSLMSIHKSKGLEFPIVILTGCGKKMNQKEFSKKMLLHPEYGITLDYLNGEKRIRKKNLGKEVAVRELQKEQLGEEIRVLYVAMTRAKEKLLITGAIGSPEDKITQWLNSSQRGLVYIQEDLMKAGNYLGLLMPVLAGIPEVEISSMQYDAFNQMTALLCKGEKMLSLEEEISRVIPEQETYWEEQFQKWKLPPVQPPEKMKLSVSEIKHQFMEEQFHEQEWDKPEFLVKEEEPLIPDFLQEDKGTSLGALKGTAFHRFMEWIPFQDNVELWNKERIHEEIDRLVEAGKLDEEQAEMIGISQVEHFLKSPLAKKMHEAAKVDRLQREKPFVMGIQAKEAGLKSDREDLILVQGIMDACFEEQGVFYIVDYKTDAIKEESELVKRYEKQMELYCLALQKATGGIIGDAYLYSTNLGKEIPLSKWKH